MSYDEKKSAIEKVPVPEEQNPCFVNFQGPFTEKGRQGYRIVNLIRRYVEGYSGPLLPGTLGGFVEVPEAIDVRSEIWIFCSARLFGTVKVSGNVIVKDADLTDSRIKGRIRIGREKQNGVPEEYSKTTGRARRVLIRGSELDAGENGRILIADYASVKESRIRGNSSILENAFVRNSTILNSYIRGFSLVTGSRLDNCSVSDSAVVSGCRLKESIVRSNAVVDRSDVHNQKLEETRCLVRNRQVRDYSAFLNES